MKKDKPDVCELGGASPEFCHEGWEELEGVQGAISDGLDIRRLWGYAGGGDTRSAIAVLEDFWDVGEDSQAPAVDVSVAKFPDDILGETFRIWIKPG